MITTIPFLEARKTDTWWRSGWYQTAWLASQTQRCATPIRLRGRTSPQAPAPSARPASPGLPAAGADAR